MPSGVKVMDGTCRCTKWYWEHRVPLSLAEIADTYVRKDSESASASLSTSLVSFKRLSNPCKVIRARILASCANMSKRKGSLNPFKGSFFNDLLIRLPFASFCPVAGMILKPGLVQLFSTSLAVVSHRWSGHIVTSTIFQTGCLMAEWQWAASLRQTSLLSSHWEKLQSQRHYLLRRCATWLAFELGLVGFPLLIFDDIWIDPHDFSRFYHHRNEALSFLFFSYWIDDVQSGFRD